MSLYDDASLVLIPSAYKDGKLYSIKPTDGTGDFTFSRGSNLAATRVDVNGLIEKGRENLLTYSNDFSNAVWTKSNASVSLSNGVWEVTDNTTTGSHYLYWNATTPASSVLTLSVEAKAGAEDYLGMRLGGYTYAFFNVSNGTLGNIHSSFIDAKIEATSDGFYRCSATILTPSSNVASVFYSTNNSSSVSYTGTGSLAITIKNAQLEKSLVPTDYIETGASTAQAGILEDMPRLDYSGGASCPSLLLEPQRTNIVTYSEYPENYGQEYRGSLTTNSTTSPEGINNASLFTEDTTANATHFYAISSLNWVSGTTYTISIYVKSNGRSIVLSQGNSAVINFSTYFNLDTGEVGNSSATDASIEDVGDGWYRCSVTQTALSTSGTNVLVYAWDGEEWNSTYTGDGISGFYSYGHQVEAGSYPTSYIPTYGAATTRSEDSATNLVTNTTSRTYLLEGKRIANENFQTSAGFYDPNDQLNITFWNSNRLRFRFGGTTNQYYTLIGDDFKIAISYDGIDSKVFINGQLEFTQTFNLGSLNSIILQGGNGAISCNQTALFPTALTDSECISLTTI